MGWASSGRTHAHGLSARRLRASLAALAVVVLVLPLLGSSAAGAAPVPAAPGRAAQSPVADPELEHVPRDAGLHGRPQTDHTVDMAEYGYDEEEYLVSGTARTYDDAPSTADYTTRMIVRRPKDSEDFNGTVIVEWNNVSAQHDQTPDWFWSRPMVVREGYAYVIVSAQQAGHCCAPLSLKTADPLRYADLDHPGDDYAFDIFSQVGKALVVPDGLDPMGGLQPRRLIAAGHSQSAGHLQDYVNEVQPHARLYQGFLIDGLGSKTWPAAPDVPVLHLLEEWGLDPTEPNVSRNYRLWEVAGASHGDYWVLRQQFDAPERVLPRQSQHDREWGEQVDEIAGNWGYDVEPRQLTCAGGGGMFPKRYAVSAALVQLDDWVRTGQPAPQPPRVEFDDAGQPVRDEHGNVVGGLRLPPIEVPVATYLGDVCELFGLTIPFDPLTLQRLYPTHDDYVAEMQQATDDAIHRGVLLPADGEDIMRRSRQSTIPQQGVASPLPPLGGSIGATLGG